MESPEFIQNGYCDAQDVKNGDNFLVEDLLDFPNDDTMNADGGIQAAMTESSTVTAVENSGNSSFCGGMAEMHFGSGVGGHFSSELCVPYDDVAELEWLSNFVEESFSSEDLQKLQLIQGVKARDTEPSVTQQYQFQPEPTKPDPKHRPEVSVPGKARSKRSRAAPGDWASRLLAVSPTPPPATTVSSSSESEITVVKKVAKPRVNSSGEGRRCLHCATDKTPQWRTGPMGPKTLCNACGVRYKSGRLVPEYRPASSPTFMLTKHSNSHRKVLELRRQKEVQSGNHVGQQHQFMHHHHHQNVMFDVSSNGGDDYLIHQHVGPNFRQLI